MQGLLIPEFQVVPVGGEIKIKCLTFENKIWKFNGHNLSNSVVQGGILHILDAREEHMGRYTCKGENVGDAFEQDATVLVGGRYH